MFSGSVKYIVPEDRDQPAERGASEVMKDMSAALSTNQMQRGVKGYTPLVLLPKFDLVWGVCPDYMHCVLEGVGRQLTDIWFKSPTTSHFIQNGKLETAVTRMLNIKPPQFFTRLPRTLDDRCMWKASEWKWWLLFYAVPCFKGILTDACHEHLCLLVSAIYLLLKDKITKSDVEQAMDNLATSVFQVQQLYDSPNMTFNMHQLLHLPKSVLQLGPLWSHSMFVFESGNGSLLYLVSGANGVPLQVVERFAMSLQLKRALNSLSLPKVTRVLCWQLAEKTAKMP